MRHRRRTYATKLLSNGVDLKTVQKLCGWRTIESAMRYLAKAQSKQVRKQVNAVFGETPMKRFLRAENRDLAMHALGKGAGR